MKCPNACKATAKIAKEYRYFDMFTINIYYDNYDREKKAG